MVMARPTNRVTRMAKMILKLRSASHRVSSTPPIIAPTISPTRSVRVANSSSDSGTGPVSRTRTPCSGVRPRSRAAARIGVVGFQARLERIEIQPRLDLMKWRISSGLGGAPVISERQDMNSVLPFAAASKHIGKARHGAYRDRPAWLRRC